MAPRESAALIEQPGRVIPAQDAPNTIPTPGPERADDAQQVRVDAAAFQRSIPLPEHPDNGDEARYPSRFASYSKGLPHDGLGDVNTLEYDKLLVATASGVPTDFEAITLGGPRMLVNPQAAYAYQLEGADSHALAIAPAPTFAGLEVSGEMEELYWMSLARDVSFQDYGASPPVIPDALQRLNQLGVYRGPRESGQVTAQTLFRDTLPGSTVGPFISQFLLLDVPYGAQTVSQRIRTRVAGDDRVFTFAEWLNIQNGQLPTQGETFDTTPRYLRNGRDLAEFVHHDFPLQSSLNAALIISSQNDNDTDGKSSPPVHDEGNPYRVYAKQDSFSTFGNADGQDLIGRIMKLALQGVWFQKWQVHRRQRPEEFAGRVHNTKAGTRIYPVNSELLGSPVLPRVFARNDALNGGTGGSYLLAQAFPEGSPVHPAYGSGHSTYVGAGVTMLKAFYKTDLPVKNPVVPSADGLSLVPYTGPALTIENELDKLAMNVGVGRLFGGVHWRSDHEHAVRLGELIALRVLQDRARTYNEGFNGFRVRTFGGNTLIVNATEPALPNHVSAVTGFCVVDANGQPVPGYEEVRNGMVLRAADLPAGWKLRVNTFPATVGSVKLVLDGVTTSDSTAPYTVDSGTLVNGAHTLLATPYSGGAGGGLGGVPLSLRFQVEGHWATTGSLNGWALNHAAVSLKDGRVLMGPVWGSPVTELYDPATGQWSVTGSVTHERARYTLTRLGGTKDTLLLLVGGAVGSTYPTATELYDPATGLWTLSGSLGQGRFGHTATLLNDGRVLVVGGWNDNGYGAAEVYNPTTGTWSTLSVSPPVLGHTATLLGNGQVLVVGGNWNTPLAFLFDPTTDTWTSMAPPIEPLMDHAAVLLGTGTGKVLVGGGAKSWLYDPTDQTWAQSGAPVIRRANYTLTLLTNGQVLMTGGDGPNGSFREAELYDPNTGTWALTSPMSNTRKSHSATRLLNGKVLVLGAAAHNVASQACELYTP